MFVIIGYAACRGVSEHLPSKDDIGFRSVEIA